MSFNDDWQFFLGDDSAAIDPAFDDADWRTLRLPHDWSIEGEFSEDNPAKPEGGGLPTGVAWYRKTFTLPDSGAGRHVFIDFDGIYRNSEVWINGHSLGVRPNGYISFRYDLTPYLHADDRANVLAVRVDNAGQPNSRWYSGSGIYRNVWLVTTGPAYVDHWGTFVTTPQVDSAAAQVEVAIRLQRDDSVTGDLTVQTVLLDAEGNQVNEESLPSTVVGGSSIRLKQQLTIAHPTWWSVDRPTLYTAVTEVRLDGKLTDRYETLFGIRTFRFDAEKGFFLNGQPLKILGVCNHHDLGALGAAVNTRAMERQLEILKAMGCNAIRTAHNPPAPELLDLCDRMGFLVMDESFDMWRKKKTNQDYHLDFPEWHARDLQDMVLRDRNHPSIFMWSIGNEIREQFDSTGLTITPELVQLVKDLDTTRPVTSALTENIPEKNFISQSGALDVLGFNYKHEAYPELPQRFPGQKFIATENNSALATRGHYDMPSDSIRRWPEAYNVPLKGANDDWTVSAYDNVSAYWGSTHEETWRVIKKYPFLSGMFIWTGFDYLGEPIPYPWPARSSYFGVIDLAGFPKDAYYLYQSEWTNDEPVLHVFPHWNWKPGQTVDVWAYYNQADEVELFLNGESLGTRAKGDDEFHVMWRVPYQPGTIKAISRKNGETVLTREIHTAGAPAKIELVADRDRLTADGRDLSFVTVKILDADGNLVPHADHLVQFQVEGEGELVGVDNGYQASMESFKADHRKAFNGLCLAIVQTTENAGTITLQAQAEGLESASVTLTTKN
ncbi:beta-galactosidase GalB [Catalinimonas alkaloidigena]|nr:beta-galactosidase GalB [Catalinimonas alkaloidigena]